MTNTLKTKKNTIRILLLTLAAATFITFATRNAEAANPKVIANPDIAANSISSDELKSIFLESQNSLNGTSVKPVLVKSGSGHEAFLKAYLGRTDAALQTHYRSLVFSGKGIMPKSFSSDAEVVSYVAKTKGAIGYVSADTATQGVKILAVR